MSEQHDINLNKLKLEQNIRRVSDLELSDLIYLVHKQPTTKEKLSLFEELLEAFKLQLTRNMTSIIRHQDKDATSSENAANLQSELAYNNEIFGKKRDDFI